VGIASGANFVASGYFKMSRAFQENVLVIGDRDRSVEGALAQALPGAAITSVANYFEGISELSANHYTTVLAAAEPIERRPEAAVKTLRDMAGDGRIILFGQPSLEPVSRKMLGFGCDDYIIMPASAGELSQMFGQVPIRLCSETGDEESRGGPLVSSLPSRLSILAGMPLAEIVLDAMLQHPQGGPAAAVQQIHARVAPGLQLHYAKTAEELLAAPEGLISLTHAVRSGGDSIATLQLLLPRDEDENLARHFLSQLAQVIGKVAALEARHSKLQNLAITDDLTGLYNSRWFKHFLTKILQTAQVLRFPVTLLLFDIDGFKTYNDTYGHGVGDDILRETASVMKRCVRDHDLVARLGGDEFAVVFWEKEGPRTPREPRPATPQPRIPQTPEQMFKRFQRLIASPEVNILGPTGKGKLQISGGMAVYPYDAQDAAGLIEEADRQLMQVAKKSGKNCLRIVGEDVNGSGELNRSSPPRTEHS
jgi:GGDEF domain-containing protein